MVARDTIYLLGTHSRDAVLYVVPSRTDQATAHRVLRAVCEHVHTTSAATLRLMLAQPTAAVEAPVEDDEEIEEEDEEVEVEEAEDDDE